MDLFDMDQTWSTVAFQGQVDRDLAFLLGVENGFEIWRPQAMLSAKEQSWTDDGDSKYLSRGQYISLQLRSPGDLPWRLRFRVRRPDRIEVIDAFRG